MQIVHHGAIDGVTGSCHQLFWEPSRSILVDCGLFQGAEQSAEGNHAGQMDIGFPVKGIEALVLTHVHIDHVGRIPWLLAAGFEGPIWCSQASAHLLPLVLEDALKVGVTQNPTLISRFLQRIRQQTRAIPWQQWQDIAPGLRVKLHPAGHILGSAFVECDLKAEDRRVVFSGDLGAPWSPLLPSPKSPWRADVLVLESTYGDRLHPDRRHRRNALRDILKRAAANRGVILIPAFSIGRTQELLYELEELAHRQELSFNVVVDSPLAARFTESYAALKDEWDKEARRKLDQGRHPLAFDRLTTLDSHSAHLAHVERLKKSAEPTVIIAASGMCSGGRIVNYLKALIEDERTDILFSGYQANGTPGRIIQQYGPKHGWVEFDDKRYTIRAGIHTLPGYSAHADQKNLVDFVLRIRHKPTEIRLVHGEAAAKTALMNALTPHLPQTRIWLP